MIVPRFLTEKKTSLAKSFLKDVSNNNNVSLKIRCNDS